MDRCKFWQKTKCIGGDKLKSRDFVWWKLSCYQFRTDCYNYSNVAVHKTITLYIRTYIGKGMENIFHASFNQKRTGMIILIWDKTDFKSKTVKRLIDREQADTLVVVVVRRRLGGEEWLSKKEKKCGFGVLTLPKCH